MPTIALRSFGGEFPKMPTHLLPDQAAQLARNITFAHDDIRALNALGATVNTSNGPVRGLFTNNGTSFFTWTADTQAFLAPTIDDTYNRVLYAEASNGLRVTKTDYLSGTGGNPSTSYTAGVPAPDTAVGLAVEDRVYWPKADGTDDTSAVLAFTAFYELNGQRYNETTITPATTTKWRKYTIAVASLPSVPTDGGTLCFSASLNADDGLLWSALSKGSSLARPVNSFPGGVEMWNSLVGTDQVIEFRFGMAETRTYLLTAVNNFDEESAPSPPAVLHQQYIQKVKMNGEYTMAGGYVALKGVNFYRNVTGGSDFLLINDAPLTPYTYQYDTTPAGAALPTTATVLPSLTWEEPPAGLKNLTICPNGYFAGSIGKDVCFSEPYHPHAWPYRITLPYDVVGMRWSDNALVVTTTAHPYIVTGVHPSAMSEQKLEVIQAGISNRAMCSTNNGVVYASNDGLVLVAGGAASLMDSQRFWTREDWRTAYSASLTKLTLFSHDGFICGMFEDREGFYIQVDENRPSLSKFVPQGYGAFVFPQTDLAYIGLAGGVAPFNSGSALTWEWQSKDFILAKPVNLSVGQIVCTGSITAYVYADGVLTTTANLSAGNNYFRLGAGFKARKWSLKMTGAGIVTEAFLATSMKELQVV